MKVVIVGGVAGGASAAARLRRLSEDIEIVLFERGPDVSFANCGLPYYLGGEIAERAKLLVVKPELLRQRFRLDVRTLSSIEAIDRTQKTVRVREIATGREYDERYDKLILATGAAPFKPELPGIGLEGVFTLRNLEDTDRIKAKLDSGVTHAVLMGGGFIGLELAENMVRLGIKTTLVEKNEQLLMPFDKEMTAPLVAELARRGVRVVFGESAERFEAKGSSLEVVLSSGERLPCELAILGIGVRPENHLAVAAGLAVGARGGVKVDSQMRTADPDIYAVGDMIEVTDTVTGDLTQVPLAGPANRQGRIAADNIAGRESSYRGTQGTAILGFFGITLAVTGCNERTLRRANRPFQKAYIHPMNHAGYYPGAEGMSLKLLFAPESGTLLGAQAVGGVGVDKRIDVIAAAIQAKMTVFDLEEMELCYAPQFGSAKDPVNMAGFVGGGMVRGDHPQISVEDALNEFLIDVRSPAEFAQGNIPGSINIPIDELRERLGELPKRKLVVYCQVGQRGYLATRILMQRGFDVANVGGGYRTYKLFYPT